MDGNVNFGQRQKRVKLVFNKDFTNRLMGESNYKN